MASNPETTNGNTSGNKSPTQAPSAKTIRGIGATGVGETRKS